MHSIVRGALIELNGDGTGPVGVAIGVPTQRSPAVSRWPVYIGAPRDPQPELNLLLLNAS